MQGKVPTPSESEQSAVQAGESVRRILPPVDLTILTPAEIVAVNRYAFDQYGSSGNRYDEAIYDAIENLPSRHAAKGLAVFELMAASTNPGDREDIARCIAGLLKVDHDHGLQLFNRFLRDPEQDVRDAAAEVLDNAVVRPDGNKEDSTWHLERRAEMGLSALDVELLQLARHRAERGEDIFQLGAVALQKLIEGSQQASPPNAP